MESPYDRPKAFADTQHLFSGNLTLGEQKKEGTQISFKDKNRRYFVLRCLRHKFLTLSGYKNIKEYKSPSTHVNKTVEQIVVSQNTKVHCMRIPSKKSKTSNVLCIIQENGKTVYLEADTSEELDAWGHAFDGILVRLGWKERPLSPPLSPLPSPPNGSHSPLLPPLPPLPDSSNTTPPQSPSTGRHGCMRGRPSSARGSARDLFPQTLNDGTQRHSTPISPVLAIATTYFDFEQRPRRSHEEPVPFIDSHSGFTETGQPRYINMRKADLLDQHAWLENTQHQERLVKVENIGYVNLRRDPNMVQIGHPDRPPDLPPRPNLHTRGNTFPGTDISRPLSESSYSSESPRDSGEFSEHTRPNRAYSDHAPKISVSEAPAPPTPLGHQKFQYLFDDTDALRKISLPQPLSPRPRRLGVVVPPVLGIITPPESPVQIRKAGSYNNLALNLSNRPLPSPTDAGSFDINTLRWEMDHTEGFPVVIDKNDLQDSLGLVRIADYVWIAGWKSGKPEIAKKLHVGDQLRQIHEQIVVDPSVANTLFASSAVNEILLIIRRLPHAKIRNLHRSSVNDSWGLEVEGNRVLDVAKSGPAADARLTSRAQGAFSERLCDWIITEIDGEPVSLLSKRDQVKNRMAKAGLQMSLVIQPDDFIKKLNAELQKVKFAHEFFVGSDSED